MMKNDNSKGKQNNVHKIEKWILFMKKLFRIYLIYSAMIFHVVLKNCISEDTSWRYKVGNTPSTDAKWTAEIGEPNFHGRAHYMIHCTDNDSSLRTESCQGNERVLFSIGQLIIIASRMEMVILNTITFSCIVCDTASHNCVTNIHRVHQSDDYIITMLQLWSNYRII